MKYLARLIQVLLILIPVGTLGWLCFENFVPSGIFVVQHPVQVPSSFVDGLSPHERVTEPKKDAQGNWIQTIFGDPVFFFVHPHRAFDSVEATITFRNTNTPIVEFGALAAKNPERYALEPIQNLVIDESKWFRLVEGDSILLQRNPVYKSIAEFLARPPSREEIATYHTDLTFPFRLPNYTASKTIQTIPVSLRGANVMKTYVKQEPLHFLFSYMDMNRDEGADSVSVIVTDEKNKVISVVRAEDDGNTSTNAKASPIKTLLVDTSVLPEGVYRVEVQTDRDVFVRSIQTTQQKLVFLNGVYLGDEDGYHQTFSPVTFWTESKRLSMQTRHATSVQTVAVGSETLTIPAPYQLITQAVKDPGLVAVKATKGDVEILSDLPIAFSPAFYFRPDPVRLLPHTDLDQLHVNNLFAKYTPPTEKDGWLTATVHLDARSLFLDKGSWKFTFSTPDITELKSGVDVKQIDFVMKKTPVKWYEEGLKMINP